MYRKQRSQRYQTRLLVIHTYIHVTVSMVELTGTSHIPTILQPIQIQLEVIVVKQLWGHFRFLPNSILSEVCMHVKISAINATVIYLWLGPACSISDKVECEASRVVVGEPT